jgi:hypothetical protein
LTLTPRGRPFFVSESVILALARSTRSQVGSMLSSFRIPVLIAIMTTAMSDGLRRARRGLAV